MKAQPCGCKVGEGKHIIPCASHKTLFIEILKGNIKLTSRTLQQGGVKWRNSKT